MTAKPIKRLIIALFLVPLVLPFLVPLLAIANAEGARGEESTLQPMRAWEITVVSANVLIIGADAYGGMVRSDDGGETWINLGMIIPEAKQIYDTESLGGGIILAGVGVSDYNIPHIARSTDYGLTWVDLGIPVGGKTAGIYRITYLEDGIVLAGTGGEARMARSEDYGAIWTDLGTITEDAGNRIYSISYLGDGVVLAGTRHDVTAKIARSVDYGINWVNSCNVTGGETYVLSLEHLGDGVVLAGTWPNAKVLRSTDNGSTWADLGAIIPGEHSAWDFEYLGDGVVLAGTQPNAKLARSDDYGLTWTDLGNIAAGGTHLMRIKLLADGVLLATTQPNAKVLRAATANLTDWEDLEVPFARMVEGPPSPKPKSDPPHVDGGSVVGGGGAAGEKRITGIITTNYHLAVEEVEALSIDNEASIVIKEGTEVKNKAGYKVYAITVERLKGFGGGTIGYAYKLAPDGITFNPPATLTMRYPKDLILDSDEGIVIAMWSGDNWLWLNDSAVDAERHTVSVGIEHFSTYAIVSRRVITQVYEVWELLPELLPVKKLAGKQNPNKEVKK